ncbi:MAG: hypothetical protein KDC35_03590 [Acidobacteria bacterium]|nr:hypothetical protein [Acidobacteriota bacterium]
MKRAVLIFFGMLPLIASDFEIVEMEATQIIQNLDNDMSLIAGKPTTVRLFVKSNTGSPIQDVIGDLEGQINGTSLGILSSVNHITAEPDSSIDLAQQRLANHMTLLFQLPESWITNTGSMVLKASVRTLQSQVQDTHQIGINVVRDIGLKVELVPVGIRCGGEFSCRPSDQEMLDTLVLVRRMYPTEKIKATISKHYVQFPSNQSSTTLFNAIHFSHMNAGPATFPQAPTDTVRMGVVPPGVEFIAFSKKEQKWVRDPLNGYATAHSRTGFVMLGIDHPEATMAHEMGHALGMDHVNDGVTCKNADSVCEPYPYPGRQLSTGSARDYFGWTKWFAVNPLTFSDMMTYQRDRWISDYTYRMLYCLMDNLTKTADQRKAICKGGAPKTISMIEDAPEFLWISLVMDLDGYSVSLRSRVFPRDTLDLEQLRDRFTPRDEEGPLTINLLDHEGQVHTSYTYTPSLGTIDGVEAERPLKIAEWCLPFNEDIERIEVIDRERGIVIAERFVGEHPPQAYANEAIADGDQLELTWSVADEDGQPLHVDIQLSTDQGERWSTVASGFDEVDTHTVLDTSNWGGTDEAILRLIACDGFKSTTAEWPTIPLSRKSPKVLLFDSETSVTQGTYTPGEVWTFDAEDGSLEGDSVTWVSDLDGPFANGTRADLGDLSVGSHVIQVIARDSDQMTGDAWLTVTVQQELP